MGMWLVGVGRGRGGSRRKHIRRHDVVVPPHQPPAVGSLGSARSRVDKSEARGGCNPGLANWGAGVALWHSKTMARCGTGGHNRVFSVLQDG